MDKEFLQNIWILIRENNFESSNEINSDYLCTICKKILIDACSAPCGCRYCRECISGYLKDESKMCPGQFDYCKINVINFDQDILSDHAINIKMLKLVVKCPNSNCESKVELGMISNHLRICQNQFLCCPYFSIGCEADKLTSDKMDEHLSTEVDFHSKLLMECIIDSRNYNESLNRELDNLKSESKHINEKLIINKERTQNMIRNVEIFKSQLETQIENENLQLEELKQKILIEKSEIHQKFEMHHKKTQYIEVELEKITKTCNEAETESKKEVRSIENIKSWIDKIRYEEFVWKMDNWLQKLYLPYSFNYEFFSHRNGYKMCLELYPGGLGPAKDTHLSIYLCIIKGPFDNVLKWPVKPVVEISLLNQKTGLAHKIKTIKYSDYCYPSALSKPANSMCGNGVGKNKFIALDQFFSRTELCRNNQIFIKCLVKSV